MDSHEAQPPTGPPSPHGPVLGIGRCIVARRARCRLLRAGRTGRAIGPRAARREPRVLVSRQRRPGRLRGARGDRRRATAGVAPPPCPLARTGTTGPPGWCAGTHQADSRALGPTPGDRRARLPAAGNFEHLGHHGHVIGVAALYGSEYPLALPVLAAVTLVAATVGAAVLGIERHLLATIASLARRAIRAPRRAVRPPFELLARHRSPMANRVAGRAPPPGIVFPSVA